MKLSHLATALALATSRPHTPTSSADEIKAFIGSADASLAEFVEPLKAAVANLDELTVWVIERAKANPNEIGAASVEYLQVFGYTAYGTSKFAVLGFAQCLRYELKPRGIDVLCFCPGEVATPGLAAEREATHPATRAMKLIGGTLPSEQAIDGLLQGIRRNRFMIVPGWKNRLTHWALRLTPLPLWQAITDGIVAHALRRP